jgi:hypothetical protein
VACRLASDRSVLTAVALRTIRGDARMVHFPRAKARRAGVARAAIGGRGNVAGRFTSRRLAVVASRAAGVFSGVSVFGANPARVARAGVAGLTIRAVGCCMASRRALSAFGALGRKLAVMTAVAPRRRHSRMAHGVGGEA